MIKRLFSYYPVYLSILTLVIFLGLFFKSKSPYPFSIIKPNKTYARIAKYWVKKDLGVQCNLCPFNCYLSEGAKGKCKVRMNKNGKLYTQVYSQSVSLNADPIEKKPVFHMLPGTNILSISTVGCPLGCTFCQNWSISQTYPEEVNVVKLLSPLEIVKTAIKNNIPSIAYTYGEPIIFYEYMYETAKLAKQNGLKNVMVTSGFINPEPLRQIAPFFDVIKVDLKGISEDFYENEVKGYLQSILQTLKVLNELEVLTEVVNLVVPTRNDSTGDFRKLATWILKNLGPDTPLFFSRFHPDYKLTNIPPTPIETLEKARDIAREVGLKYVYIGNVSGHEAENTYCPKDHTVLIKRKGYHIIENNVVNGKCPVCGEKIPGVWK